MASKSAARRLGGPWAMVVCLLALIVCDLAQVALRLATYPSVVRWPGAGGYVAEAVAPLAAYALIVAASPLVVRRAPTLRVALWVGAVAGAVGGVLEIVDISFESLLLEPQAVVTVFTGAAMVALFLLFAAAGFIGARRARAFGSGVAAAVWSAMVAIIIAVTFGFLLMSLALPQLAREMIADPDYARSGWADPTAFAIANTFDSAFIHLLEAPIIAAVLGSAGAGIGLLTVRRRTFTPP